MTKRDVAVIESAKDIRKYCSEHEHCRDCIFYSAGNLCRFNLCNPNMWELPKLKTYKEDFLEKFPNANFKSRNICRKMIYGEEHDCRGMTCEGCWNEVFMEK